MHMRDLWQQRLQGLSDEPLTLSETPRPALQAYAGAREQFIHDLDKVRSGQEVDPDIRSDDVIVVQRNARRTALRDSLFGDILNTLNPFK